MRVRSCVAGALALTAFAFPAAIAEANKPKDPPKRQPASSERLQDAVSVKGILSHERAFQSFAERNGGTRAAGTPGYDRSAEYVAKTMRRAGFRVSVQNFEFPFFDETAPSELEQVSPTAKTYAPETDFATMTYSGAGDVTAPVQPVGVVVPPGAAPDGNTSGCEAADFAGFVAGNVALLPRGTCEFAVKARNAQEAGAAAAVIFNEGQPGRQEALTGTLGGPGFEIPVLGASYAAGEGLVNASRAGETTVRVFAETVSETRTTSNVLADSTGGRPGRTVVVGAHLDSVNEGPGINDNGSGSAGLLEIAEAMKKTRLDPRNRVRFAFWGAEELGLLGSTHYVDQLPQAQRDTIAANLNYDMIGSPNYARFIYDGDGSITPDDPSDAGPVGSDRIERIFERHFRQRGLATEPTAFDGRSDYGPFIAAGIPAGGLFSGAEGVKTEAQARLFGGTAGEAFDPCYHEACDTIANVSEQALDELGDGATHATYRLAMRKRPLYGQRDRSKARQDRAGSRRAVRTRSRVRGLERGGSHAQR